MARFVEEDGYGDLIDWYVAKNPDTSLWHLLSVDIDGAWEWVGTKREVKKKFVQVLKNNVIVTFMQSECNKKMRQYRCGR